MRFRQFAVRIRTESRLAPGEGPEGALGLSGGVGRGVRLGGGSGGLARMELEGGRCFRRWCGDGCAGEFRRGCPGCRGRGLAHRVPGRGGSGFQAGDRGGLRRPGNAVSEAVAGQSKGNRGFWGFGSGGNPALEGGAPPRLPAPRPTRTRRQPAHRGPGQRWHPPRPAGSAGPSGAGGARPLAVVPADPGPELNDVERTFRMAGTGPCPNVPSRKPSVAGIREP